MMGPTTLREIREELRRALAATGDDPICWLEKRMSASKRRRESTVILESLLSLLTETKRDTPRKRRPAKKK